MFENPHNLNPQQKIAATAPAGPLLIVAGAGTGKTRTLTSRLAYFIEQGIRQERICAITFTNKAANEMRERISANSKVPIANRGAKSNLPFALGRLPFIGTFHSLGAKILRKECRFLGRKPNFTIFDDHDSFDTIKKITKKLLFSKKAEEKRGDGHKSGERPAYFAQKISEIKNVAGAPENLSRSDGEENRLALKIFKLYEKKLEENNAFDFDDLIEKVVFLFRTKPEMAEKYQNKFDAILVDEYQDLNPMQYELVKFLAGGRRNLSVVGDDEQLIYAWRHASLKTFLDFERDWPGAQIAFLEENYRSTANIIGAASAVAANNIYRRQKNLWTKNPAGEPIKIFEAGDEDEEAEWMAGQIATSDRRQATGKTTAVLYRTNAQSRAIEQALIRKQIPYRIFGGIKFYERKEIKDIVAALRLMANKNDGISRDRLEKNLPKRKFSNLMDVIAGAGKKAATPAELINIFLKTTDYAGELEKNFANYAERLENVSELVNFASRYNDLRQFLEEIALVQSTDAPLETYDERLTTNDRSSVISHKSLVNLMTIHLAKGLEFDKVFIAGAAEGLLPHARSMDDKYQLEEERRLMYVAMTRAKKNLYISFYDVPSRFISEIPDEFAELENKSENNQNLSDEDGFVFYD